jgi:hypothetical protein
LKILGVALLTAVQFYVTYLLLNCYFGWFDDFQILHLLNGEVTHQPSGFFYMVVFNLVGEFIYWFYQHYDGVNWYGIFLYSLVYLSILNINVILLYLISPKKIAGFLLFILFGFAFYAAFLIENVYLLNFTRVGLLLLFTSFLSLAIFYKTKPISSYFKYFLYTYFFVLFFVGLSIRPPVSIMLLPFCGWFLMFYFPFKLSLKLNSLMAIVILIYVGMSWITLSSERKADMRNVYQSERYMLNILDGQNLDSTIERSQRDEIKLKALNSWYFADQDSLLNNDFLKKFGGGQSMTKQLTQNWRKNLKEEYLKASSSYSAYYLPQLNWWYKSFIFTLVLLLIPLVLYFSKTTSLRQSFVLMGYLLLSIFYILIIAILIKMEDRVLAPILIFLLLSVLICAGSFAKSIKSAVFILLAIAFSVIGAMRSFDYYGVSVQRAHGLKMKEYVRLELDQQFADKYIVFDFFTMLFLETSPFEDVNFSDKWISGIEVWNRHLPYIESINKVVGCQKWPCFFEKIAQQPYDFIFFYKDERISITEDYFDIIYDTSLKFEDLSEDMVISKFHYSLHWVPFDFGYYRIDEMVLNNEIGIE